MKQFLKRLASLAGHRQEEAAFTEQSEQFAQSVLDRYRTSIQKLPPQNLLHIKTLVLEAEKEPAAVMNISNWNTVQIREKETISKLFYKIQNLDAEGSQTQKKIKQDSSRIEKLERQIKESTGIGQKLLKKIHSHTEREIRSVREETLFLAKKFHRGIQSVELESQKLLQETIQEGFRKELRILRQIQEERQDVLLVYPDIQWYLRQNTHSTEIHDSNFLPQHQEFPKNPVLFRHLDTIQEGQNEPTKQKIQEIVKEQLRGQSRWLAEKIYRRLERQLFDEKKRRGF